MTYDEYRTYTLTCEYLNKEPTGQYKKVYDFLNDLWEGMEFGVNPANNRTNLQKKDGWVMEQDSEDGILWCQDNTVWSFFQKDMGMGLIATEDFVKNTVDQYLDCQVGTPFYYPSDWVQQVEQYLDSQVGTPIPEHHKP